MEINGEFFMSKSFYFNLLFTALAALPATAFASRDVGNGGDMPCEPRMIHIRDEIKQWINGGGPKGLELPPEITLQKYNDNMLSEISQTQLSCTSNTVKIGGSEKACRNYVDDKNVPRIECNRKLFMDADNDTQYVLIHHEFAGLAGFEANDSDQSKYPLSNQLSAFRDVVQTDRLSLTKFPDLKPFDIFANFGDFVGEYKILKCAYKDSAYPNEGCSEYKRASIAIYQDAYDTTGKSHFVSLQFKNKDSKFLMGVYPVIGELRSRYQNSMMSYGFYSLWQSGMMINTSFVWDHGLLRLSFRQGDASNPGGIPYVWEYNLLLKKVSNKPVDPH
jgi:hypothetical protein